MTLTGQSFGPGLNDILARLAGWLRHAVSLVASVAFGLLLLIAAGIVALATAFAGLLIAFAALIVRFTQNGRTHHGAGGSVRVDGMVLQARRTARGWRVE